MYLKKELYELIRTDERIFDFIQDSSLDGLWYWDLENLENEWMNAKFWKVLGYNPDEMPHQSSAWQHIINHDDLKVANDNFTKHCEDPNHPYDQIVRYTHKNGSTVWIRCRGLAIRDHTGKPIRMLGAHQDISDIKRSEQVLKESELKFRALFEKGPIGVAYHSVIYDSTGKPIDYLFLDANKAYQDLTGVDPRGKLATKAFPGIEHDPFDWIGVFGKVARTGETIRFESYLVPNQRWYDCVAYQNKPDHFVAAFLETTKRKKAEIKLQEINENLNKKNKEIEINNARLESLLNDLTFAKEKAEESDRLKSAFLANMSHEIRTPMNGILGFANLLKEPNLTGENQKKYIAIIEKSGLRMLNIINDIVDISKIEAGVMEVFLSESNINEQLDYIYSFFKHQVETKGMHLILSKALHERQEKIITDQEKLLAVLTNLVKNAIKFTHEGVIEFGCNKKGSSLEFFVRDTGVGIHKDRQHAIFDRFVQADIEDKEAKEGAGLGLAISKAYVEMLEGEIWVESEKGKGSTFYFTLPYHTVPTTENTDRQFASSGKAMK